jgi:hypothetical protein
MTSKQTCFVKWKASHGIGENLIFNYNRFLVRFIFELMNLSGICNKLSHAVCLVCKLDLELFSRKMIRRYF